MTPPSFVIIKYSNNQMLSQANLHKEVIFFFSFLNFSEQYNIVFKYRHYQTIVLVKQRNTNIKYKIKKPVAGAARILIFYSPPPFETPKNATRGDL